MGMWEGEPKSVTVTIDDMVKDELDNVLYDELYEEDDVWDGHVDADYQTVKLNIIAEADGHWTIVGVNNIPLDFNKRLINV